MEIVNQWNFIIIEKTNLIKKESRNPIFGVDVGQSQQIIDKVIFYKFKVTPQFCEARSGCA